MPRENGIVLLFRGESKRQMSQARSSFIRNWRCLSVWIYFHTFLTSYHFTVWLPCKCFSSLQGQHWNQPFWNPWIKTNNQINAVLCVKHETTHLTVGKGKKNFQKTLLQCRLPSPFVSDCYHCPDTMIENETWIWCYKSTVTSITWNKNVMLMILGKMLHLTSKLFQKLFSEKANSGLCTLMSMSYKSAS